MEDLKGNFSLFPLRLLLIYALFVGVLPTIEFWMHSGDLEATEDYWDRDLVLSVLVSVPLVVASWAALRNVRRVPILGSLLIPLMAFHLWSTSMLSFDGFLGEPYSDPGLSAEAFHDYAVFFGGSVVPFAATYLIWFFWPCKGRFATIPATA